MTSPCEHSTIGVVACSMSAMQTCRAGALGEPFVEDELVAHRSRVRCDRLSTASRRTAHDRANPVGHQALDQGSGLRITSRRQRPNVVVLDPANSGIGVANDEDLDAVEAGVGEHRPVTWIGESEHCVVVRPPVDDVDLVVRYPARGVIVDCHREVLHGLVPAPAIFVFGLGNTRTDTSADTGFFVDLAHSGHGPGFARVDLALGETPVVVVGSVHDEDASPVRVDARHDSAGGGHRTHD